MSYVPVMNICLVYNFTNCICKIFCCLFKFINQAGTLMWKSEDTFYHITDMISLLCFITCSLTGQVVVVECIHFCSSRIFCLIH